MNTETSAQTDYEALAILGQALDTVIASYKQLLDKQQSLDFCKEVGKTACCLARQYGSTLRAFKDQELLSEDEEEEDLEADEGSED